MVRTTLAWEDEIAWFLLHSKGNSFRNRILKLSLSATVYMVWDERHCCLCQHKSMDASSLASKVCNAYQGCSPVLEEC